MELCLRPAGMQGFMDELGMEALQALGAPEGQSGSFQLFPEPQLRPQFHSHGEDNSSPKQGGDSSLCATPRSRVCRSFPSAFQCLQLGFLVKYSLGLVFPAPDPIFSQHNPGSFGAAKSHWARENTQGPP